MPDRLREQPETVQDGQTGLSSARVGPTGSEPGTDRDAQTGHSAQGQRLCGH